jgi:hypothetical protein
MRRPSSQHRTSTRSTRAAAKMLASTIQFTSYTPTQADPPQQRRPGPEGPRETNQPADASGLNSVSRPSTPTHDQPGSTPTPASWMRVVLRPTTSKLEDHSSTIPLVNTTSATQTDAGRAGCVLLRKEVIQPHLPVRLPCYDFVPIASPTFDGSIPQGVRPPASGVADFRDVTGGVYKARERIHRSVADLRLLATPTSWGRVADPNPN